MTTLSTSAWVLHDLGLAAGFGGPLFGRLALGPAARQISSRDERERVLDVAWRDYNVVDAISLGIIGATWLASRTTVTWRLLDKRTRGLLVAKDVIVGAAIATGAANIAASRVLARSVRQGTRDRSARGVLKVLGPVNIGLLAGAIGLTAVIGARTGRGLALRRLLPE